MQFCHSRRWVSLLALFVPLALPAAEADVNAVSSSGATDDATTAIRKFRAAPGFKIDLFAAEPMLANVVSFAFDEHGRCYVVESNRRRTSVFDIRGLGEWLDADYSFRTVADRANFFRTTLSSTNPKLPDFLKAKRNLLSDYNRDGTVDWRDLEVQSERIRLLVDTNADGRADSASVLAEGFDGITSGVAAGVLARKGDVWFTCIPDLWKMSSYELRMTKGVPKLAAPFNPHLRHPSFVISNLLSGFGVHIAFGGHDMHGLKIGPDGKIYFSIADRGTSTNLWDKITDKWPGLTMEALADSGAVFRCEPDGTEFEVVCIGLRNPQELAFDEFGNLFAGENNADGGDKARWIHVVEGADYGWRIGWQWLPKLGAWNSEMLWGMAGTNTSAYYLPPVAHIGAGPAGIAYYPGTGLPARYDRHFFMCDFRGGPNSVVRAFALRPKGASFEAYDESEFLTGPLCTDVDFGTDGAVYVSDWVKGWEKTDQGRIYRVFDPSTVNAPAVLEVKKLLSEGMEKRANEELARLLGHRDMRVRLEAQWELAERARREAKEVPTDNLKPATPLAALLIPFGNTNNVAQFHAMQGLASAYPHIFLKTQKTWNIRELIMAVALGSRPQAIENWSEMLVRELIRIRGNAPLDDPEQHIVLFNGVKPEYPAQTQIIAARGLGKQFSGGKGHAWDRQRASKSLLTLLRDSRNKDAYLRHAAVLALARIGDVPALLAAAKDESPAVRLGVCLALRRLQRPEIAQFLNDADPQVALEAARAIYDAPIPEAMPALAKLTTEPSTRTGGFVARRILNAHFRLGADENAQALATFAASDAPDTLRAEALELLALWPQPPGRDRVVGLWRPLPSRDGTVAAQVLAKILAQIESTAPSVVKVAAKKAATELGLLASAAARSTGDAAVKKFSVALENGSLAEKQSALATLAALDDADAAKLLSAWLDKLVAGQVAKELQLDVLEAVGKSQSLLTSAATKEKLAKFEAARDAKDALAKWRECLYGGNAEEGKKTFIERQDAACFRCHKINGEGGEVGPEMAGLGTRHPREYILEAILYPNKTIAPGFESVLVTLKNGTSYAGLLKSETDTELVINSPEDGLLTVKKADVKTRDRGLSAMPEELGNILSKSDVRNLIEFLSTLK